MKVWNCPRYGGPDVLRLVDRPRPLPGRGEVLVRVEATTVSSADSRVRALRLPRGFGPFGRLFLGFSGPRRGVLGTELAGRIAAVGPDCAGWRTGDEVVGFTGAAMGCHAEYRVMPARGALAARPAALRPEEAAALGFGGTTALDFLRRAQLAAGESVLVLGAAGTVGSACVQFARHAGAQVTAVTSPRHLELMARLGAVDVVDRTREDFRKMGRQFDVIADAVGLTTFAESLPLLRDGGRYLGIAADLRGMLARPAGSRRPIVGPASERPETSARWFVSRRPACSGPCSTRSSPSPTCPPRMPAWTPVRSRAVSWCASIRPDGQWRESAFPLRGRPATLDSCRGFSSCSSPP
jgi:NADPH:quinone reductase-like Zn-dependent oxidoreductase